MKNFILFFCALGMNMAAMAQGGAYQPRPISGVNLQGGRTMDMNLTWRAIDVSKFNGIEGSPFLSKEYKQAFVKTRSGEKFSNVWIRFNTFNNEILLENDSQLVALTNVDSISYLDESAKTALTTVILKTGYPAVDDQNAETIYRVLVYRGGLQLLKYYETKVENIKKMGMPDQKTFVTAPRYYIYEAAGNTIKRVKLNKSLLEALKNYPDASKKASELSVNFRDEKDIIRLLSAL